MVSRPKAVPVMHLNTFQIGNLLISPVALKQRALRGIQSSLKLFAKINE